MVTAVIGLGNILLRDEGVGVHVVNAVRERFSCSPEVEIIDGGTLGLDLLPLIEGKDRLLLVDAIDFGKEPGYIGVLRDDQIPSTISAKLSVHHIGLSDVLYAAKLLGVTPSDMRLIGIQPESLEVGLDVTECIGGKMEELIGLLIITLKEWKIECALQSPHESSA
ncbi:MAG: HyaD/HybD family hydrogenase maturation endopeptidase [Nitrospirae bacterium]|nr:HyaD/HybD family hydrogenase maturation endopeptidase [Nitrospirota bacterium]